MVRKCWSRSNGVAYSGRLIDRWSKRQRVADRFDRNQEQMRLCIGVSSGFSDKSKLLVKGKRKECEGGGRKVQPHSAFAKLMPLWAIAVDQHWVLVSNWAYREEVSERVVYESRWHTSVAYAQIVQWRIPSPF